MFFHVGLVSRDIIWSLLQDFVGIVCSYVVFPFSFFLSHTGNSTLIIWSPDISSGSSSVPLTGRDG